MTTAKIFSLISFKENFNWNFIIITIIILIQFIFIPLGFNLSTDLLMMQFGNHFGFEVVNFQKTKSFQKFGFLVIIITAVFTSVLM